MYNFNHLYYFYITAKYGGVSNASKILKISQPSLSSQLKVLEGSLHTKLFKKAGRNNLLSDAGSLVYGYCRQMFEVSELMKESLTSRVSSGMRKIHIGISDEVDRPFVVEVVSLFLKKHKLEERPAVILTSGSREKLLNSLQFRELDVVVSEMATTEKELNNLFLAEAPVALVCPENWKAFANDPKNKSTAKIREFTDQNEVHWVMPSSRFKLRAEINQFFEANELKGRVVFESDVMASLVRSVIDEIGLAFLPLFYVAREVREKSLRIVGPKNGYWIYRVWLVSHNQNSEDTLIKTLCNSFSEICDEAIA